MMNELRKPEQCMSIYTEIKQILMDLGLTLVQNPNCDKLWTMQRGGEEKVKSKRLIREDEYMQKQERIQVSDVTLTMQDMKIPHRMLEWYVKVENMGMMEAVERAIRRQQYKMETLRVMGGKQLELYNEIGIRQAAIHALERDLKGRIIEIVTAPETLSWKRPCKIEEAIEELKFRPKELAMIMLNMLQPEQLWEYGIRKEKMQNLIDLARQAGVPPMIMSDKIELENQNDCIHQDLDISQSYNLINIYDVNAAPEGMMKKRRAVLNLLHFNQSITWCRRVVETWSKKLNQKVNNMYMEESTGQAWFCPLCLQEGRVINKFYGQCLNNKCLVVTTAESIQDIRMGPGIKRKVETVILGTRVL